MSQGLEPVLYKQCFVVLELERTRLLSIQEIEKNQRDDVANTEKKTSIIQGDLPIIEGVKKITSSVSQMVHNSIMTSEQCFKMFPIIISIVDRILSRCIDITKYKLSSPKLFLALLECLVATIIALSSTSEDVAQLSLALSQQNPSLRKILILVTACLECLKSRNIASVSSNSQSKVQSISALTGDDEVIIQSCFQVFSTLVNNVWAKTMASTNSNIMDSLSDTAPIASSFGRHIREILKPQTPVNGPMLAQIVQSSLAYGLHKSKHIAREAILTLSCILTCLGSVDEWRQYYPGVFSGLHIICTTSKRGSSVSAAAFSCILKVTAVIANDDDPVNSNLMRHIMQTSSSNISVNFDNASSDIKNNISLSLEALYTQASKFQSTARSSVLSTSIDTRTFSFEEKIPPEMSGDIPGQFPSLSSFVQWRVDLLQRVETFLPKAYYEVMSVASPRQILAIMSLVTTLCIDCEYFLGPSVGTVLLLLLLRCYDDNSSIVRAACRHSWDQIKTIRIMRGTWNPPIYGSCGSDTEAMLTERFLTCLETLGQKVSSGSDLGTGENRELLMTALGSGQALGRGLETILRMHNQKSKERSSIAGILIHLVMPDLSDSRQHLRNMGVNANSGQSLLFDNQIYAYCCVDISTLKKMKADALSFSTNKDGEKTDSMDSMEKVLEFVQRFEQSSYGRLPWHACSDERMKSTVRKLCALIGKQGGLGVMLDHLESICRRQKRAEKKYVAECVHQAELLQCYDAVIAGNVSHPMTVFNSKGDSKHDASSPEYKALSVGIDAVSATSKASKDDLYRRLALLLAGWTTLSYTLLGAVGEPNITLLELASQVKQAKQCSSKKENEDTQQTASAHISKRTCAYCGKGVGNPKKSTESASSPISLSWCSRCRTVSYCSRDHQSKHWAVHKLVCGKSVVSKTEPSIASLPTALSPPALSSSQSSKKLDNNTIDGINLFNIDRYESIFKGEEVISESLSMEENELSISNSTNEKNEKEEWDIHSSTTSSSPKMESERAMSMCPLGFMSGDLVDPRVITSYAALSTPLHPNLYCNKSTSCGLSNVDKENDSMGGGSVNVSIYINIIKQVVRTAVVTIQDYIKDSTHLNNGLSPPSSSSSSSSSSVAVIPNGSYVSEHSASSFSKSPLYTGNLRFVRQMIVSAAAECIAHCALLLCHAFRPLIREVLYCLLELSTESDALLRQAALCSLHRIAMYLHYKDLSCLIQEYLDIVVDDACINLRTSPHTTSAGNSSSNRTHLIVDFVFQLIGTKAFGQVNIKGSSLSAEQCRSVMVAPLVLLKEMVLDSLDSIDGYASAGLLLSPHQIHPLLKVMSVLVCRAVEPTDLKNYLSDYKKCVTESKTMSSLSFQTIKTFTNDEQETPLSKMSISCLPQHIDDTECVFRSLHKFGTSMASIVPVESDMNFINASHSNNKPENENRSDNTSHIGNLKRRCTGLSAQERLKFEDIMKKYDELQSSSAGLELTKEQSKKQFAASAKIIKQLIKINEEQQLKEQGCMSDEKDTNNQHNNYDGPYLGLSLEEHYENNDAWLEKDGNEDEEEESTDEADEENSRLRKENIISQGEDGDVGMKIVMDILERCRYFIALPILEAQVAVVDIIRDAFVRLANDRKLLLPAVHNTWPSIISRLKEQKVAYLRHTEIFSGGSDSSKACHQRPTSTVLLSFGSNSSSIKNMSDGMPTLQTGSKRSDSEMFSNYRYSNGDSTHMVDVDITRSKRACLLLPPLLDLITVLAALSADFFSSKFRNDIWPELTVILRAMLLSSAVFTIKPPNQHQNSSSSPKNRNADNINTRSQVVDQSKMSSASQSLPTSVMRRSDLIINTSPLIASDTSSASKPTVSPTLTVSPAEKIGQHHLPSKFSVDSKMRLSILRFFRQIVSLNGSRLYVQPCAGACVWFCIPLLGSHEAEEVVSLCMVTITELFPLNPPLIETILQSILTSSTLQNQLPSTLSSTCIGGNNDLWRAVVTEPSIVAAFLPSNADSGSGRNSTAVGRVPEAEKILAAYLSDGILVQNVRRTLSSIKAKHYYSININNVSDSSSSESNNRCDTVGYDNSRYVMVDKGWVRSLAQWSSIA